MKQYTQLHFSFIDTFIQEEAEFKKYNDRINFLLHEKSSLVNMLKYYPLNNDEYNNYLRGIRPARLVRESECHDCSFDCLSHCPDECLVQADNEYSWHKICIRDFFSKCVEWNYLPPDYPEIHDQLKASINRYFKHSN